MTRATWGKIARYATSAAIIVLLVVFARTVDWPAAWASMRSASLPLLLAAIGVNLLSLIIRGVRWWILLRAAGAPSLGSAIRATVAGAGLNNVLVASGGDAARVVFVTRTSGISSASALATVALDRLFDPVGFLGLLAVGVIFFDLPADLERLRWPAVGAFIATFALLVWLGLRARSMRPEHEPERRSTPRGWTGRFRSWLVQFGSSVRALATGPRILWIVALTFLAWLAQLATFALAARAVQVSMPLEGHLAALLAINVALIVRLTPGNVGFFQFAYALAAGWFGVSREKAIAVSLLIQTLQIIPVTLLGVALAPEFVLRRKANQNATATHPG